jgi:hypothetical protein
VRPAAFALLLSLAGASGTNAQIAGRLDAGSGTMRTGSESPFGIVRIAPSFQFTSVRFLLTTEGDFAGHTEHGWQSKGRLAATVRQTLVGQLEARLGIQGAASRTRWGRSAGGLLGEARLQLGSDARGLSLGLGSGSSFTTGSTQPLSRIEAGGWSRVGRFDLGFWLKHTGLTVPGATADDRTPGDTLQVGGSGNRRTLQDHYTDVEATLGWTRGNFAVQAGAGRRFGKAFDFGSWHVTALYQVTSRVALVASSGRFPVDVVSGLPSGAFTTLSMRFHLRDDAEVPRQPERTAGRIKNQLFTAVRGDDGNHLITIRVPQANVVELMGDFTDWNPVLLVPGDADQWLLRMRIPPGMHEVNVRIDGGAWTVPAGLTAVDDGLGGRVGIFSLE